MNVLFFVKILIKYMNNIKYNQLHYKDIALILISYRIHRNDLETRVPLTSNQATPPSQYAIP